MTTDVAIDVPVAAAPAARDPAAVDPHRRSWACWSFAALHVGHRGATSSAVITSPPTTPRWTATSRSSRRASRASWTACSWTTTSGSRRATRSWCSTTATPKVRLQRGRGRSPHGAGVGHLRRPRGSGRGAASGHARRGGIRPGDRRGGRGRVPKGARRSRAVPWPRGQADHLGAAARCRAGRGRIGSRRASRLRGSRPRPRAARSRLRAPRVRGADAKLASAAGGASPTRGCRRATPTITAPVDGIVARRSAEPGALVQVGQNLLSLVPDRDVWVTANLKETQLATIKVGDSVEFTVDAYPDHDVPRQGREPESRHRRAVRAAPARQRHRQLHQGGAARSGADRGGPARVGTDAAAPGHVGRSDHRDSLSRMATLALPARRPVLDRDQIFRARYVIAFAVTLASVLELVDTSIVNVAIPHMMGNLGATLDEVAWVEHRLHRRERDRAPAHQLAVRAAGTAELLHRLDSPVHHRVVLLRQRAFARDRWCSGG